VGPLERKIHDMTRADDLPPGGSMSQEEMFMFMIGHFNKLEFALLRLAAEIDGFRKGAASTA
jgi:hypothetical protein